MNVPYFIRIKDDNEKKSKKRLLAVNMYVECTCTSVMCVSLLQSGFQRPDAIQRLQGIFLTTSDRLHREGETAVPFLIIIIVFMNLDPSR